MHPTLLALAALTLLAATPRAQGLDLPTPLPSIFPTPIHTAPSPDGAAPYGYWSAGADHKVSFGQQVTFYPLLGAGHAEHLPVAWRSESITVDGVAWRRFDGDAEVQWDERRWALVRGDVVERWDMCERGVEQSFVLHERPAGGGELVLRGAIETPLHAPSRAAQHAPIEFCDARGRAVVRYGEAFAFDANGDRIALGASYDGATIGLHVPGDWLATARLPVTIDPLLSKSNFGVVFNSDYVIDTDAVSAVGMTGSRTLCVTYSRLFLDGDVDAFGLTCDQNFANAVSFFQRTGTEQVVRPRCAYCRPVDAWVVTWEHRTSAGAGYVYAYQQSRSAAPGTGSSALIPSVPAFSHRRPDIAGMASPSGVPWVRIVYEFEEQGTPTPLCSIRTVVYDCTTQTFPSLYQVSGSTEIDSRSPAIVSFEAGFRYAVAWHSYVPAGGGQLARQILMLSRLSLSTPVAAPVGYNVTDSSWPGLAYFNLFDPCIDGDSVGRFTVALSSRHQLTQQPRVEYMTFDWSDPFASTPVMLRKDTLTAGTIADPVRVDAIAFDLDTQSHWCVVHRQGSTLTTTRLGATGAVVEQANLVTTGPALAGSVSYSTQVTMGGQGRFPIFFSDSTAGDPIWRSAMYYPTTQLGSTGPGCYGAVTTGGPHPQPYLGNGNFSLVSSGLSPDAIAVFAASTVPVSAPVPGAPGCTLYVDPATLFFLAPQLVSGSGGLETPLPLAEDPSWLGDVHLQLAWLDPSLNGLGLGFGSGLRLPIR